MIEKNGEYRGVVSALGTGGEGIIKIEDTACFVSFCLPGEEVEFKALKVTDGVAYGKLLSVLKPSPDRVKPLCPVFGKCGGCDLQHLSYPAQLEFKRGLVKNSLFKIGGIDFPVSPCVPCAKEYGYRNKLVLPVQCADGEAVCGFYAPRSHRIVPIEACPIQRAWTAKIISAVKKFAACGGEVGLLRRIVVRELDGKFIIAVVAAKKIPLAKFAAILDGEFESFTLVLNVNGGEGNAVFGKEWHICRGEGVFDSEQSGIKFSAGANTFVQVNDDIREKLYGAALAEAEGADVAIDLYSGGGLLTAMLAKKCKMAYGVEIVEEASRCADRLKQLNGLDNMIDVCGAVEQKLQHILNLTSSSKRIVVCDPPRKGMERAVVNALKRSGAGKIVLISCNPATLARDMGLLTGALAERDGKLEKSARPFDGYSITSVTPFDMFPQTRHVETLAVLQKM